MRLWGIQGKQASKAAIVKELLGAKSGTPNYPAAKIQPRAGKLTWMITQDAAGSLRGN